MAHIEIDGKQLEVADGSTIIDAADALGLYIPRFCYHKKLSVAANCRMCLVQVEKSNKPVPACATPVTDGMKIATRSDVAIKAQQGVMEFLLINHPLDCPICDQGGECELQDLAVGYGAPKSRYQEAKRVVLNKDLGSLIATDMTRCIHCTRCVRFGVEIGGIMEMGQTGRGEHSEIGPYVKKAVASELSGNMIDLCPVGALTSKPFRYTARTWELSRRPSISPHDGFGSNLTVHVKQNRVMRILPRENEAINECWLSDRDRFGYEGLNAGERLKQPMLKQGGEWHEVDWPTALDYVAHGLKDIVATHGADQVGALAAPHATLEELYLLQKLLRALGSRHIDTRLRQADFSADGRPAGAPWLGSTIAEAAQQQQYLVIGSNLRKEQPLLAHRVRQATKQGARLSLIGADTTDPLCRVAHRAIVAPGALAGTLAQLALALSELTHKGLPADLAGSLNAVQVTEPIRAMAQTLLAGEGKAVWLGNQAQQHPQAVQIRLLAQAIADLSGATLGLLSEASNSTGAVLAGAVPMQGPLGAQVEPGLNARAMLEQPRRAYLLLDVEPEFDLANAHLGLAAMQAADTVIVMSPFKSAAALQYADVLLPVGPFTETSGTFVSMEGRLQSFNAAVKPLGETRPGWKVLRVLGNMLGLAGFDYESTEEVRNELTRQGAGKLSDLLDNRVTHAAASLAAAPGGAVERVGEVGWYQVDSITRHADSLQKTPDAKNAALAWLPGSLLARLGLAEGDTVRVRQGEATAEMTVGRDDLLPDNCARIAAGLPQTAGLGDLYGAVTLERTGG
jgi:NADH-quinone oxidoreductase subunit G